jgi:chorismate-pyruvate lyase
VHTLIEVNNLAHSKSRAGLPLTVVERAIKPLKCSPLQRILLVTDGTVTEILEAYSGESMRLVKLLEQVQVLSAPLPGLELAAGERAVLRQILLQGKMSLRTFLFAESYIALDRLDDSLRAGLLESHKPIGFLMQERRMETFREILGCGHASSGSLAHYFDAEPTDSMLWRTYRVISGGQPIMQITEKFPESQFLD